MPSLRQCKKLIAESEKDDHKPTISHYRDIENSMLKTKSNPKLTRAIVPNGLAAYKERIAKLPSGTVLKSELIRIYNELVQMKREAKAKNANRDYFLPRIKSLESALQQGLRSAKNPTFKKTVVSKKTTTVKKSNPVLTVYLVIASNNHSTTIKVYGTAKRAKEILKHDKSASWLSSKYRVESFYSKAQNEAELKADIKRQYPEAKTITIFEGVKNPTRTTSLKPAKAVNCLKRKNFTKTDFKQHQKIQIHELAKMFQGKANGLSARLLEPDTAPPNKFRLGFLALMKIRRNGQTIPIEFDKESVLSADHLKRFWVVGKDSRIENGALRELGIKVPRKGDLAFVGNLSQIDYVTAKAHIENGETVHFYHKLGEADHIQPQLYIDHDRFPIIHGGNYDIWNVGIVN